MKFKVGKRYFLSSSAGIDSGKEITIIPWFWWREATCGGLYKSPDPKTEVAIRFEDGTTSFVFKRLLREERE